MQTPPYLKKGDKIKIISPAGRINPKIIDKAKKDLEIEGFIVEISANAKKQNGQFAGTDNQRLNDFQDAINDKSVNAILCSRGGYGLIRIIDDLDFSTLLENPKWIIGFSDITIIHSALNNLGLQSLHSSMALAFAQENKIAKTSILNALTKGELNYTFENHNLNKIKNIEGELIGGNLSILVSLIGTKYQFDYSNKILFIEDLNEYLYRLDRMLYTLKFAGVFDKISGLVVGQFSDMIDNKTPFGKNAYEIILELCKEYNFPIIFDFPAGHITENNALISGCKCTISFNNKVNISQKL